MSFSYSTLAQTQPVKERYTYIDSTDPSQRDVTAIERIAPNDRTPVETTLHFSPSQYAQTLEAYIASRTNSNAVEQGPGAGYTQTSLPSNSQQPRPKTVVSPDQPLTMQVAQPQNMAVNQTCPKNGGNGPHTGCTPVTDLLLPEQSTMVYTDEFFQQPQANLFLQTVQPNVYSYAVDLTPINALANGISYTPQIPPKFRDQVYTRPDGNTYPIYTRIDPQLIRDQGVPSRLIENPVRGDWSAHYSSWNPPAGSVNTEDIYDPRYNGYGDPYRSYSDVNLGQVQYYYSDVDAMRRPNFVTRSKVDFIEYTDPMNKVKPYYQRTASLNDVRPYVENQWMSDSTYFRENLMEEQMRKRNSELWQLRYAPQSKASHTRYFTSAY